MFAAFCCLVSLIAKNALAKVLQAIGTSHAQGKYSVSLHELAVVGLPGKLLNQLQVFFLVECFCIFYSILSYLHIHYIHSQFPYKCAGPDGPTSKR